MATFVSEVGGRLLAALAIALFASALGGCGHFPPDPKCQGDPALKPCTCMDPRTLDCPPPPADTKKPHKETAQ